MQFRSSAAVVVGLIQVSVRQKRSGLSKCALASKEQKEWVDWVEMQWECQAVLLQSLKMVIYTNRCARQRKVAPECVMAQLLRL